MRLLPLPLEVSKTRLALAILAGIINGTSTVAALVCVLESLRGFNTLWWQFGCFAALAVASRAYARMSLNALMGTSILRLRRRMIRSILDLPLQEFERIGAARLLVGFTTDLASVGAVVRNFVHLFSGAAFIVACLAYLAWLTPQRAAVTAVLLLLAIAVAVLLRQMEKTHGRAARAAWDRAIHVYKMVLDGVKQMKLNRTLSRQVLRTFESRVRDIRKAGGQRGWYSEAVAIWVQTISFVIIGVAVFGPFDRNEPIIGAGYGVLALLYMRGPLQSLISDSGAFADASIALQRINDLGLILSEQRDPADVRMARPAAGSKAQLMMSSWHSLSLRGVMFQYDGTQRENNFVLGPLDISLHPGEVVFVAGGNGSGKTTLLKVLTGLYAPTKGAVYLDDVSIGESNARLYRSNFAVVFSDFCLFEDVADLNYDELGLEAELIGSRFKFKQWMLAPRETFDASVKLSAGERRRVALLMALLEERSILVFDEWAADQDPQYKNLFYTEIVPSMRAKGKLVIVLSHDERYFHLGDRVLWLERGARPVWRAPQSFSEAEQA